MREIKFRAWDKLDGKMYHTVETIDFKDGVDMRDDKGKGCFRMFENVDLMQYTGLKDKNGKEIYERDIVDWSPVGLGVVRWIACGFAHDQEKQRSPIGVNHLHPNYSKEYEVIGNIYENPNLLPIQPKK